MTLNNILYEATMEVLEGLGEDVLQSLVWQMGNGGVSFAPDSFDIKAFSKALRELFGDGSDSLLEEIYQNAICRLELLRPASFVDNNDGLLAFNNGANPSPLHKLLTLFGGSAYDGFPKEE